MIVSRCSDYKRTVRGNGDREIGVHEKFSLG